MRFLICNRHSLALVIIAVIFFLAGCSRMMKDHPAGYDEDMTGHLLAVFTRSLEYTVSGRIFLCEEQDVGHEGVLVRLTGPRESHITTIKRDGSFYFDNVVRGVYNVTAVCRGCFFAVPSREVRVHLNDITEVNFYAVEGHYSDDGDSSGFSIDNK